jgi:cytidine deaminase
MLLCVRDPTEEGGAESILTCHAVLNYIGHLISVDICKIEVFTAVTMKNGVFWDVTPCGSCKNRRFEGT